MLDRTGTQFSHIKPNDTPFRSEGLRSFFQYRDLGVSEATHGKVIAHLVRANEAPEKGTGWHRHEADFHIVIMLKGWAKFMYEDKETLVAAGCSTTRRTWNTWRSSDRRIFPPSRSKGLARCRCQPPGSERTRGSPAGPGKHRKWRRSARLIGPSSEPAAG